MNKLILIIIIILYALTYFAFLQNSKTFEVTFLDVGQGDATLIQSSNGNHCLIDVGKGSVIVEALSKTKPFLHSLDCVILTHADADHIEGFLSLHKRYEIKNLFINYSVKDNELVQELKNEIVDHKINTFSLDAQTDFYFDDIYFDVLWPSSEFSELQEDLDANDASIVVKLSYNNLDLYLGGDIGKEYEDELIIGEIEGMKASHHGSNTSTSENFLRTITPQFAVTSSGKNNSFGHPHKEVLERLEDRNIEVFRTDLNGSITLVADGQRLQISCEACKTTSFELSD